MTGILLRKIIEVQAETPVALGLVKKALNEATIQVADRIPKKWDVTDGEHNSLIGNLTLKSSNEKESLSFKLEATCMEENGASQFEFLYTSEKSNPDLLKDVSNKTHTMLVTTLV